MKPNNVTQQWIKDRVVIDQNGCWIWQMAINSVTGYGVARHNGRTRNAAAVSFEMFKGPIPAGHQMRHKCHVRPCVNPDHLLTGTSKDNHRDMDEAGRRGHGAARGTDHPSSKLSMEQVRMILSSQLKTMELARLLGVTHNLIYRVKSRKSYVSK